MKKNISIRKVLQMKVNKPLEGKVAKILNSRELIINKGSKDGVTIGMRFDVLDPKGVGVVDPDTKIILGSVLRPKVRIEIISLQEKLSVASTYKKREYNAGGTGVDFSIPLSPLASILMPPNWVTKYETLKTTETTWEDLEESESYVKTGDPVVEVSKDKPTKNKD